MSRKWERGRGGEGRKQREREIGEEKERRERGKDVEAMQSKFNIYQYEFNPSTRSDSISNFVRRTFGDYGIGLLPKVEFEFYM